MQCTVQERRAALAAASAQLDTAEGRLVVVGGGAVGVELAAELAEKYGGRRDIMLLAAGARLVLGVRALCLCWHQHVPGTSAPTTSWQRAFRTPARQAGHLRRGQGLQGRESPIVSLILPPTEPSATAFHLPLTPAPLTLLPF